MKNLLQHSILILPLLFAPLVHAGSGTHQTGVSTANTTATTNNSATLTMSAIPSNNNGAQAVAKLIFSHPNNPTYFMAGVGKLPYGPCSGGTPIALFSNTVVVNVNHTISGCVAAGTSVLVNVARYTEAGVYKVVFRFTPTGQAAIERIVTTNWPTTSVLKCYAHHFIHWTSGNAPTPVSLTTAARSCYPNNTVTLYNPESGSNPYGYQPGDTTGTYRTINP